METKNATNNEKTIGNIVECLYRVYRVQTPDGLIVEVKSDEQLSHKLLQQLIEEDIDMDGFFKHHTILGARRLIRPPVDIQKKTDGEHNMLTKNGTLNPRQRLNVLLKMTGVFTRLDYVKFLDDNYRVKLKKWTSHNDIQDAVKLNRLETVEGEEVGKVRKYRVIDPEEIGESLYKKLLEDRKLKIDTLT